MKKNKIRLLLFFALVALGVFSFAQFAVDLMKPGTYVDERAKTLDQQYISKSDQVTRTTQANARMGWESFKNKYGQGLEVEFDRNGQLVWIKGKPNAGQMVDGFDPRDPQKAIRAANQILKDAHGMMGYIDELPVENPIAKTGRYSAQVYYSETYDGVPIAPSGQVRVDLGPNGELIRFDSDYVQSLNVDNQFVIPRSQALANAKSAVDIPSNVREEDGKKVVWMTHSDRAKNAYEYYIEGRQVVVDAESGEVIYKRDRRMF